MDYDIENLIVGAGPAGLAMAGQFHHAGLPYLLLEKAATIGSSWRNHYERLHLHTTKDLSYLPHLPFPAHYPQYVPRQLVVDYLDAYVQQMQIKAECGVEITAIQKTDQHWLCSTQSGDRYRARHVVVATGFNRVPVVPSWPGMADFGATILHSRDYRSGKVFAGKKVLVIGMGNTGAELAIDLHEQGAQSFISVRGPVNIVLRDLKFTGRSTQETAILLAKLPVWLGDIIATQVSKLTVGDLRPFGIERPAIPPSRQLRELGKTPVIDVGTVNLIRKGHIQVLPDVSGFLPGKVRFADDRSLPFDAVVLATGYRSQVGDFIEDTTGIFNDFGVPAAVQFPAQHPGLYFLGFDAYSVGGLLRTIRLGSQAILEAIQA